MRLRDEDSADDTATITHAVSGLGDLTDGGTVSITVEDEPAVDSERLAVTDTLATVTAAAVSNVTTNIGTRFSAARGGTTLSMAGHSVAQTLQSERASWDTLWYNEGHSRTLSPEDLLRSTTFQIALGAAEGTQAQATSPVDSYGGGAICSISAAIRVKAPAMTAT